MKRTSLAALTAGLVLTGSTAVAVDHATAMTGGVTQVPEPAWAVRIDIGPARCTGTLITDRFVLTAGHCVTGARADQFELRSQGRIYRARSLRTPDGYEARQALDPRMPVYGDLGLIELTEAVAEARPLPLASWAEVRSFHGRGVTTYGYGFDESGMMAATVRKSPDHAWQLDTDCPVPGDVCFSRHNSRTAITGGDSGGPWVGWTASGWKILAVVSGYPKQPAGRTIQAATSPAAAAMASWIKRTLDAPRKGPAPLPTPTAPPGTQPGAGGSVETQGTRGVNTFTNYHNASGMGPRIAAGEQVTVSCKVYDPAIVSAKPDGYWYRIASQPWNGGYYAPANTFMNGDPVGGPYTHNTDFAVPDC